MPGALDGIRILDLSSVLMGPYATQTLGDMGADVIKVESPDGDLMRQVAPARNAGMGALFINSNRSKRSIVLDLKAPEGRAALLRLAARTDIFVYNMRPQAMARLGLTYEDLLKVNPKILYVGVFGYGQDGPYASRPAYDDLIQGIVGYPSLFERAGGDAPRYVPHAISDRVTGLIAANAILGALYHRARTGEGQRIDVPMFESMAAFMLNDHLGGYSFDPPIAPPGYVRQLSPERRPYRTKDGYICTMIYNDKHWAAFSTAVGPDAGFMNDARFASFATRISHSDEVLARLSALFLTRPTADWIALMEQADVPVTPLHTLESLFTDPHLKATGFFSREEHPSEGALCRTPPAGKWSRTQPAATRPAPRLGEHSAEVLAEIGYSAAEIDALRAAGVIKTDEPQSGSDRVEV